MEPVDRLQAILTEVVDNAVAALDDDRDEFTRRREDIIKAAGYLIQFYGDEALDRARSLEATSSNRAFARSVRKTVESIQSDGQTKLSA